MKKIILLLVCLISLATCAFGQFVINDEKWEIVDWYGRVSGEPAQPAWLMDMLRGNGVPYCQANGLTDSIDRKFFAPHEAIDISLENARTEADRKTLYWFQYDVARKEIYTSTRDDSGNYTREIIVDVDDVWKTAGLDLSGVRREGEFWQKIRTTESDGRVRTEYHTWSFYSISESAYNELLQKYQEYFLQAYGLDEQAQSRRRQELEKQLMDSPNKRR